MWLTLWVRRLGGVGSQEVINNARAVLMIDGTQAGQPSEGDRPHELTQDQLEVELIEFATGLRTLQKGIERMPVVIDDPRSQCMTVVIVRCAVRCGAQRHPGQGGHLQRCLLEERGLPAEQLNELVPQ